MVFVCVCVCVYEWEGEGESESGFMTSLRITYWSLTVMCGQDPYITPPGQTSVIYTFIFILYDSHNLPLVCVCASRFHLHVRWRRVLLISRTARCVVNGFPVQSILVSCPFPVASMCGYLWVSLHIIHTKVSAGGGTFSFQFWGFSESIFTSPAPLDWAWLTVCYIPRVYMFYLESYCSVFIRTI